MTDRAFATTVIEPSLVSPEDWRLVCQTRLNSLFVGPNAITRPLVRDLLQGSAEPVLEIVSYEERALPPAGTVRTVVLSDITALSGARQSQLMHWLDQGQGTTQVISTAATPILPLLQAGTFDRHLYYRLNTYYVDLTPRT